MRLYRGDWFGILGTVLVASALGAAGPVMAHSWYPRACCNDLDCTPVDRVEHLPEGGMRLTAGHIEVIVPPGFPVMQSADARVHVCTYRNMAGQYLPRCVFLPGIS